MELWVLDALELVGPAFIEFNMDGTGQVQFIAVEGHLDGRFSERDGLYMALRERGMS